MFRLDYDEQSSISGFVEKKTRMFKSKVDFVLNGEHVHYFNKKQCLDPSCNPKCKVCGLLLSDFKVQKKLERLNKEIQNRT